MEPQKTMHRKHLTLEERQKIQFLHIRGLNNADIGRMLGRASSCIGRELKILPKGFYDAEKADALHRERLSAARKKQATAEAHKILPDYQKEILEFSPPTDSHPQLSLDLCLKPSLVSVSEILQDLEILRHKISKLL